MAHNLIVNPGSVEAIARGCTCPVVDNGHGRGCGEDDAGRPKFWINMRCPIHGRSNLPPAEYIGEVEK